MKKSGGLRSDGVVLNSRAHPEPNGLDSVFQCNPDSLEDIEIEIHLEQFITKGDIRNLLQLELGKLNKNIPNKKAEDIVHVLAKLTNIARFL